ncbi:MAG TPA: DUF5658 family protein [Steroidobacteraceae bacterium]|nr:DUF5658 family protein [Steroidobacteraceae bacterium]
MNANATQASRRRGSERRRRPLWSLLYGSFRPRRRSGRRCADAARFQALDWHASRLLPVAIAILLLCAGDAVLTLALLSSGAFEANPFMALVVGRDAAVFVAGKTALTGIGVMVLVSFARYRFMRAFRAELALYAILVCYAALIGYEFWLLRRLGVPALF